MKKILLTMIAIMAILPASADNYFSLRTDSVWAVNDTLWLYPNFDGNKYKMYMTAHLDGYIDHWYLKMTHPANVEIIINDSTHVEEGPAMSVPYINMYGVNDTVDATLLTNLTNQQDGNYRNSYFGSTISTLGYWDPYETGIFQSYGTVKWPTGDHDYLISFWLQIPYSVIKTNLTFDLTLMSTSDWRGVPCVNANPIRNFHIHVGYMPGDVNGDGRVSIVDVIIAQDIVLNNGVGSNAYEEDAADINQDGAVTIGDITDIIELITS